MAAQLRGMRRGSLRCSSLKENGVPPGGMEYRIKPRRVKDCLALLEGSFSFSLETAIDGDEGCPFKRLGRAPQYFRFGAFSIHLDEADRREPAASHDVVER